MFTKEEKDRMRQELLASFRPATTASERAERRWYGKRSMHAVATDLIAQNRVLLARLEDGVYAKIIQPKERYKSALANLHQRTKDQLKELEEFSKLEWME
jgi:hypothetical protein